MARSLRRVRQHGTNRRHVGVVDSGPAPHVALPLGGLLGEDVALVGAGALDRAAAADLEPLGGAALGLHLRHDDFPSLFSYDAGRSPPVRGCFKKPRLSLVSRYARAGFAATLGALGASVFGASCFGFSGFPGGTPFFLGASTITICLPSSRGNCSTRPTASRSFFTRSSSRSPNSLCAISRPRKRSVTFALSPSSRNCTSLPSLIL